MTQRIDPFFSLWLSKWNFLKYEYDSQNWIFFQYESQNWSSFFLNMTFFFTLNFFFEYDSKNWNSPIRLRGFNFFSLIWLKVLNFFVWLSEFILFFKKYDLTHRMEPLFMNLFSRWLKELKSFFLTQRIEPFLFSNVTQRIKIFFFSKCLKEFNLSFMWTIFYMTQRT